MDTAHHSWWARANVGRAGSVHRPTCPAVGRWPALMAGGWSLVAGGRWPVAEETVGAVLYGRCMSSVFWFRRDLRLADNPALAQAAAAGPVLGLFILDPRLVATSGAPRLAVLYRTLRVLNEQLEGRLVVRHGSPVTVLPAVCSEVAAESVHCAHDYGPYGRERDEAVAASLPVPLLRTGSAYAVAPGRLNAEKGGIKVYSPFYRAWLSHGWPAPVPAGRVDWVQAPSEKIPDDPDLQPGLALPDVGEQAAGSAWHAYRSGGLGDYPANRDRPDLDATSHMSVHLKWGTIHPRTLLAQLAAEHEKYRKELAWREFYADVLFHRPDSAREYYRPELQGLHYATGDRADELLHAWQQGRTGYPIVDAGMRQLLVEGWVHNRIRMIVASFLVKDLHIEWTVGARHFLNHLIDGDLASNNHGWQWVAGSGTDAAPYFRIFNPTLQGHKFDPAGDYVRRYVPELRDVPARYIHEPGKDPQNTAPDYPPPIVDHLVERNATLADYQSLR